MSYCLGILSVSIYCVFITYLQYVLNIFIYLVILNIRSVYAKVPQQSSPCVFSTGMLLTITTTRTQLRGFDNVPVPPGWSRVQMEGRVCPPAPPLVSPVIF